jgi:hypothetical protein
MELAAKLQKSESMARQLAQGQREAQKSNSNSSSQSKSQSNSQSNSPGSDPGNSPGNGEGNSESQQSETQQSNNQQNQNDRKGKAESKNGEQGESSEAERLAEQQRDEAEDARTVEDILKEAKKDASTADADLVRALDEAAEKNSPKEIAEQMEKAAKALAAGDREKAGREIDQSAQRWEALADQLESARRNFEQPKLEALIAAEKQASELLKELNSTVPGRQRSEIDKRITDLQAKLNSLADKDGNLVKIANNMSETLEAGSGGGDKWKQVRPGYYHAPTYYPTAIDRVVQDLQVRIQEIILKDAVLDSDQPVPEQYRKQVEEYYKTLSKDLR